MMAKALTNTGKLSLFIILFCGLFSPRAFSQDPPSRVARLNYMGGSISMQPAGADGWSAAVINRPFTTGDYLWAGQNSKAELHLNDSAMRISSETSFGFLNLDDRIVQVRLAQGELNVHLANLGSAEAYEIDTPNGAISLLRNGDYRFNVDTNAQSSLVIVRRGQAEVTGGGQAFNLSAGQSAQLSGTGTLTYDVENAPGPDGFESFCMQRDAREARIAAQARYAPPDMIGYEDLYDNGAWREVPSYGWVWYPRVAAGWAPYRNGHWAWIEPWGWTWVDDAPWGFAPFHYGRWAYAGGGWCWTPGPVVRVGIHGGYGGDVGAVVARPVYAPALVAFFGGPHFSVSLSIGGGGGGGLAWVPLGPGEVYTPAYHVTPNYFKQVNVSNTVVNKTVNITNVYNNTYVNKTVNNNTVNNNIVNTNTVNNTRNVNVSNVNQRFVNAQAPGAVTAMPQSSFASGRPVSTAGQSLAAPQVARLQSANSVVGPPVAPTRQALAPNSSGMAAARPPANVMSRQVVAQRTPPPAPAPFAARQQYVQQSAGRPLNMQAMRQETARQAPAPREALTRPATPMGVQARRVDVTPGSHSEGARPQGFQNANGRGFQQANQPVNHGPANVQNNVPRPPAANPREQSLRQQQIQERPERQQQRPVERNLPGGQPVNQNNNYPHPNNANVPRPPNRPNEAARPEGHDHPSQPQQHPHPNEKAKEDHRSNEEHRQ